MNRYFFYLFLLFLKTGIYAQQVGDIAIIPQPVSLEKKGGNFEFNSYSVIEVPDKTPEVQLVSRFLAQQLLKSTGFPVRIQLSGDAKDSKGTTIAISLNRKEDAAIGNEGYTLEVASSLVILRANKPAGLFYGAQTLLQLFPKEIESNELIKKPYWVLPGCKITDYPRFGWRGLMLDVSRHFFSKKDVLRFIDDMVKYKYNILHWHLTDDQGWRIEIKSYPKLTEIGAWRVPRVGKMFQMEPPSANEARTYGGFYTQEDIKEIVQYAKDRFINVLPEIDVPGHSVAAVASYPELSCTPASYRVNSGEKMIEWPPGGHFYGLIDNTLCPANEKVYEFLDNVFTEVASLFPFEYIHMGGDETARNFWEKSDAIKGLMKKENLKDLDEVQSYFVNRVEKIIESKGRKLIGWDEILQGGLPPNAAVMSWRGEKGGIEAAKQNHKVVMTPSQYVYLDYNQGDAYMEPPIYASLRLQKTYQYEPVPEGVNPKLVLGSQGNLWTEQVPNIRSAQYMTWPRGLALAETMWSPKEKKNWNDFVARVEKHFERLEIAQTKFARTMYDPIITAKKGTDSDVVVEMKPEVEGLDIYYSFDETHPDNFYPKYIAPVSIPKSAIHLKVITYKNGKMVGRQIDLPVAELKKRAGVK